MASQSSVPTGVSTEFSMFDWPQVPVKPQGEADENPDIESQLLDVRAAARVSYVLRV